MSRLHQLERLQILSDVGLDVVGTFSPSRHGTVSPIASAAGGGTRQTLTDAAVSTVHTRKRRVLRAIFGIILVVLFDSNRLSTSVVNNNY